MSATRYNAAFFGQLAQLVEQRIENPRVRGSIPRLATSFLGEDPHGSKALRVFAFRGACFTLVPFFQ